MSEGGKSVEIELVPLGKVVEALRRTRPFAETSAASLNEGLAGLSDVERVTARAGTVLVEAGEDWRYYWLVLDGETRAERIEPDGARTLIGSAKTGDAFGEVPI